MATINKAPCATEHNLIKKGSLTRGKIVHLLFTRSKQDILTLAQLAADPKTNLQALLVTDAWKNRAILVKNVTAPENNGEGIAYETINQKKYRTDKGTWDKIFLMEAASEAEYQQCEKIFDGSHFYVAFIDEHNEMWCKQSTTGVQGFRDHQVHMLPVEEAMPGATAKHKIRVSLSNIDDVTKNAVHFPLTDADGNYFDVADLETVEDVLFTDVTPEGAANGVHEIAITGVGEGCGEFNIVELLEDVIDDATLFSFLAGSGNAISISSVTVLTSGTGNKTLRILADVTDTDYADGQPVYLSFKALSVTQPILGKYLSSNRLTMTAHES